MRHRVAVLMTCHNRKAGTLACLGAIGGQELEEARVVVFLVDDGSRDGTAAAVRRQFPEVRVLEGDGSLYWGGGMRAAWDEAAREEFDFYLWVNDDALLAPDAVATLLDTYRRLADETPPCGIVVGSTCDPDTGQITYGGYADVNGVAMVRPSSRPQRCIGMNGNIVLVANEVFQAIGGLSPEFRHTSGDYDYALRAIERGFSVWVAPGILGRCRRNGCAAWCDPALPLAARWKALHGPKGQPPREKYIYARRHLPCWPLVLVKLYLKALFPRQWQGLKRSFGRA